MAALLLQKMHITILAQSILLYCLTKRELFNITLADFHIVQMKEK